MEAPAIYGVEPYGPYYGDVTTTGYYHPGDVITVVGTMLTLDADSIVGLNGAPVGPIIYNDDSTIVFTIPRGTEPGLLQVCEE